MNKSHIIICCLSLLLLVAGCSSQSDTSTGGVRDAFIGGSEGLGITFEDANPPPEVTDSGDSEFFVIVKLENKGEFEVSENDVTVSLEGILPTDFSVSEQDLLNKRPRNNLEPARRSPEGKTIDGGIVFVEIPDSDTPLIPKEFAGNTEFTFRANVCYRYETRATGRICVLKDFLNKEDNALCDPNSGSGSVESSGSPVQISNFDQSVIGKDRISFSFDVSDAGPGQVFKRDSGSGVDCPSDSREIRSKEDRVLVTVDPKGLTGLDCNIEGDRGNSGHVRLINDKRTVTCTLDLTNQHNSDFEHNIEINAEFNYEDFAETKVLVKHLID